MIDTILALIPQQAPFRFIDEILAVDDTHIVGAYTYKKDEYFYTGHFPGEPITPGVILVETMAQTALAALGIYLFGIEKTESLQAKLLFTHSSIDFVKSVLPGDKVIIKGEKNYFRMRKLSCKVQMETPEGERIAYGTLEGMIVFPPQPAKHE